jgi:hypothetical protein
MSVDPYIHHLLDSENPCTAKPPLTGKICVVLHARAEARGLELCPYPSRALLKHEIHELILTAESEAKPGAKVNKIAYLGYFEVLESGVLWVGDRVDINSRPIGFLAGYDLTHFPNHMNIVIRVSEPLYTGAEANLDLGAEIRFVFTGSHQNGTK